MSAQKTLAITCLFFAFLTSALGGEKKHMIVVSGASSRQMNDHP